ncbi:hypothetical protein [Lederbergia lenta]|uniref:hypothetical protein n=1 Tax=Lederbergia lenta TaxID=1467 RepID=UPI00203FACF9|nr:hypothetical protein [Lederbergia lenta]MCM3109964.1 hypothetical protein [Lederbergia lenta]
MNKEQKEQIEKEYKENVQMGEVGYLAGIGFMLSVIGETEFSEYLDETYIV